LKGDILVKSEPGQGSEFSVTIPVEKNNPGITRELKKTVAEISTLPVTLPLESVKEEQSLAMKLVLNQSPEEIPDDRLNITPDDKVILIIEDDTAFAKALLDFTRKKGYKGLVSVRGDLGIEMAVAFKPSGILLDVQLPMKNGLEVIEELKNNPVTRPIPVHIISSYDVKKESLSKGAIDFITKPLTAEKINSVFEKLEYVLNRRSKKVLIIEDNSHHAKALAYYLGTNHVNAAISESPEESMQVLQQEHVDCVILDMGIPDQNAYQVLDSIKSQENMEDIPIIVFTGKNLSLNEEFRIKQYADSIVIKTAHSYRRILDELSIFLHLLQTPDNGAGAKLSEKLGSLHEVLKNKRVLIADDDVRNIFSITKALEQYKMKVIPAMDGKEALELLEENKDTDIILMDIMMPKVDGYEAIARIKNDKRFKNIPIIAVTAKAMLGDREKCIQAGASDYISKPVDIDQLISLLRVWLYEKGF
ncbi:MAG: response regulator, partial [Agriterribacter sp.]